MAETKTKSFAESLLREQGRGVPPAPDEAREGATRERQHTAQALMLRLVFKDGRRAPGLPWAHFGGYEWTGGEGGRPERIEMIFGGRCVEIEGFCLFPVVEQIDEGQLKAIQEHNAQEVELLRGENADLVAGKKRPIITRIAVDPPMRELMSAIRGEDHDAGFTGRIEGRRAAGRH
jgi:hypothetical protein